jgi:ADP-ribose pyrophosphatase YjhB (NUDIX family)
MRKRFHPDFCTKCDQYLNKRSMTIDAVILIDQKVLLIKRAGYPYKDYWALPGGFVDMDETIENALIRETREETSLEVISYKLLGIYSSPTRHPKQLIAAAYIVEVSGNPKAGDDAKEFSFFPVGQLPLKVAFDHRLIISDSVKYGK